MIEWITMKGDGLVKNLDVEFNEFFDGKSTLDIFQWFDLLIKSKNMFQENPCDIIGWYLYNIGTKQLIQENPNGSNSLRINPIFFDAFVSYFDREIRPQM